MSDVQGQLKEYTVAMLIMSVIMAPIYGTWAWLHKLPAFLGDWFTFVGGNTELIIAVAGMIFVWRYISDFKKLLVVGIIIYILLMTVFTGLFV